MSSTDPQVLNITVIYDLVSDSYFVFGGSDLVPNKEGPPSASEEVIKSLKVVKIEEEGLECAICLDEFVVGGEAKVMNCRHKFHCGCLEKWLRVNGSCPVCRCKAEIERCVKVRDDMRIRFVCRCKAEIERCVKVRDDMRIRFVNGQMVISW